MRAAGAADRARRRRRRENRRRPFAIIAGLAISFFVSVLFATWILDKLGLPKDLLRNISIGLLFLIAAILIVPQVGTWIERPLSRLSRRPSGDLGGGFVLGCALGFVFVPCAGPALAYVTSSAASRHFGLKAILIAVAYTIGFSIVLLAIALGGRRVGQRLRAGVERFRVAFGVADRRGRVRARLQLGRAARAASRGRPTSSRSTPRRAAPAGKRSSAARTSPTGRLPRSRQRPSRLRAGARTSRGISRWFNTKPLTIAQLRGKVVLIDFWTYSCINCLRTLPHLEAWDRMYRTGGLVIVGVHTPEFAFESVPSNVGGAVKRLGIRYPVALDPNYDTWNHYGNQYWPAEYLIDRQGHVRHAHFGEGEYNETEESDPHAARREAGVARLRPAARPDADRPAHAGDLPRLRADRPLHRLEDLPGQGGDVRVPARARAGRARLRGALEGRARRRIVAGRGAALRLRYYARKVYIVLGGNGSVQVLVDGKPQQTDPGDGGQALHASSTRATITTRCSSCASRPGVEAYSFTFG